ncbi:phosphate acyltransferase PlsX [Sessilibacter corallicola]
MSKQITIAVDAMGGDHGLRSTVPASIKFAENNPKVNVKLFAVKDASLSIPSLSNLEIRYCESSVAMDESISVALRRKMSSSMAQALVEVENRQADICVSAGNTAALLAFGYHILGAYSGLKRPAICKPIPTLIGHSYMLDLGANVNVEPSVLHDFAKLGCGLSRLVDGNSSPKVALLNIGTESKKGNEVIQQAHALLKNDKTLNYSGFIEGDSIYSGHVDVIVCDGFVGNVALKVSEGVARMALSQLKESFKSSLYGRALGQFARPLLRKWRTQFDPARYNGACFLGLNGSVIKSHGSADSLAFQYALEMAHDFASKKTTELLRDEMAEFITS